MEFRKGNLGPNCLDKICGSTQFKFFIFLLLLLRPNSTPIHLTDLIMVNKCLVRKKKIICIEIKYSKYDKEYKIKHLFLVFLINE